jgi:aminocarboxymuconate-semialdehyde decarboxylase
MKFYPLEKIVFASDCPFDPEKGTMYIRETLRLIEKMDWTKAEREQVCITRTWSGSRARRL